MAACPLKSDAQRSLLSTGVPFKKGESLQGFATLQLPSGLVLHDCAFHEGGNGAGWIGMPARSYTTKDGNTSWQRLVDFADRHSHEKFQQAALAALDEYFAMIKKAAVIK